MAHIPANALFPNNTQYWRMPVPVFQAPVQPGINWPLLLALAGVGALVYFNSDKPTPRRCGTCGKTRHDTRGCSQNPAKRVRLRMEKTGWCSCCNRRFQRTEAHHYAGPADGNKGREMCGTCHLVCGHGGRWQNMATNPRYCRL